MAAITTAASGPWSSTGTWSGGTIPGNGDTVTLNHDVTVSDNRIIGTSGASGGTAAINVGSAGSLTINTGISLTVRGDVIITNNKTITLNAGAIWEFDSHLASPTSTTYFCQIGTAHVSASKFICNGTAGNRCIVRSNSGGGNGYFNSGGFIGGGIVDADYTDFTRIGDGTNEAIAAWATSGTGLDLNNCIFDGGGKLKTVVSVASDGNLIVTNCSFKNTIPSECTLFDFQFARTTGTWNIIDCVFDKTLTVNSFRDVTIKRCFLTGDPVFSGVENADGTFAEFSECFLHQTGASGSSIKFSMTNVYWIADTATVNPHFATAGRDFGDSSFIGCIFEYSGSDGDGDCIALNELTPGSTVIVIRNCIVLPNAAGACTGTLVTQLGNANLNFSIEHCTYFTGTQGVALGETYTGHTGMLTSFKSNIAWDTTARGYKLYDSGIDDSVTDLVSASNADFNCGLNLLTGSNGKGYNHLEFSSGSPGANDVDVDPAFVDPTRDLASWYVSINGSSAGSEALDRAAAMTELRKRNDASGYDPRYSISALLAYIRAGFAPTAIALRGAAHDGTDIGAVPVSVLSAISQLPARLTCNAIEKWR